MAQEEIALLWDFPNPMTRMIYLRSKRRKKRYPVPAAVKLWDHAAPPPPRPLRRPARGSLVPLVSRNTPAYMMTSFRPRRDVERDFAIVWEWCYENGLRFGAVLNSILPALAYALKNNTFVIKRNEVYVQMDFGLQRIQ